MPLRPVSELGLVDLTDLASREDGGTARGPSTRAPRTKAATRTKSSSGNVKAAGPRPVKRSQPATNAARRSQPAATLARRSQPAATPAKRSQPAANPARRSRAASPGQAPRSERSRTNVSRDAHHGQRRPTTAMVGIPVISGAIGIAGGILLSRISLHR